MPVAFLVVGPNNVKLLPVDHNSCLDRLLDYVPDLMEKLNAMFNKQMQNKKDEKAEEIKRIEKNEAKQKAENIKTEKEVVETKDASVKPKKARYRKPSEDYEFEYDETEENEDEE